MTFTLTEQEANIVIQSLGKQPFELVYQVIAKMQKQANEQLTPKEDENAGTAS